MTDGRGGGGRTSVPKMAVILSIALVVGSTTGVQGLFHSLAVRGLFYSKCSGTTRDDDYPSNNNNNTTTTATMRSAAPGSPSPLFDPCVAQSSAISEAANFALSMLNFAGIACGFTLDLLGARWAAVAGMVLWTLGTCVSGLHPSDGTAWVVGMIVSGVCGNLTFMSLLLVHVREAAPNPVNATFWMAMITATRMAPAVLLNVPLALYFTHVTQWSLAELYLCYGTVVGLPLTLLVAMAFEGPTPQKIAQADLNAALNDELRDDNDVDVEDDASLATVERGAPKDHSATNNEPTKETRARGVLPSPTVSATTASSAAPPERGFDRLRFVCQDAKSILLTGGFVAATAHTACVITFGYFFIANLGHLAAHHHVDKASAERASVFIMGAVGATTLLPGHVVRRLGPDRGVAIVTAAVVLLLASAAALTASPSPSSSGGTDSVSVALYAGFVFFFTYRMWATALVNQFLALRFVREKRSLGVAFGVLFTVCGAVSTVVGGLTTRVVQDDPARFTVVIAVYAGVAGLVDATFLATVVWGARRVATSLTGRAAASAVVG